MDDGTKECHRMMVVKQEKVSGKFGTKETVMEERTWTMAKKSFFPVESFVYI